MPHRCTNCGHVFTDLSEEMLSGCPACDGTTFQYQPGEEPADTEPTAVADTTPAERAGADSATDGTTEHDAGDATDEAFIMERKSETAEEKPEKKAPVEEFILSEADDR